LFPPTSLLPLTHFSLVPSPFSLGPTYFFAGSNHFSSGSCLLISWSHPLLSWLEPSSPQFLPSFLIPPLSLLVLVKISFSPGPHPQEVGEKGGETTEKGVYPGEKTGGGKQERRKWDQKRAGGNKPMHSCTLPRGENRRREGTATL